MLSVIAASLRKDWPLHLLFLALLALRLYALFSHEIWRDEGQYFLYARDADSFWGLLQGIRYERSLALWPSLLYGLQKIGLTSVFAMQVLHVSVSALLLGVLIYGLRQIPLLIRGLAGASYILMYEYTAIARRYGLTALLLGIFLLLELRDKKHTVWKALVLCLMAMSNTNGLIMAIALAIYMFFSLHGERLKEKLVLVSIVGAGILFSAYMAWAPADISEASWLVDYRTSAFTMLGIPRALQTLSHIALDGFLYIPQITSENWWDFSSIMGHWLLGDSRLVYIIGILAAAIALWFLIKIFRAHIGLGLAIIILWAGHFAFFATMHPGDIRHLGIPVLGTLALFALVIIKYKQFSAGQIGKIILYTVLIIQAVSGIWAVYAEGKQTFSQARNVAEWLESNYPQETPIIYPDFTGVAIAAYTEGHFLSLESGKEVSFVQMNAERSKQVSPMLVDNMNLKEEWQLLITDFPFEPRIIDGRIVVEPLQSFGSAIEKWEGYYHIYRIRPEKDVMWQTKLILSEPSYTEGLSEVEYLVDREISIIKTSAEALAVFSYPEDRFDNAVGSTAEIKMKLLEGPNTNHDASLFSLQDGTREGKVSFFNDRIEVFDVNILKATHIMVTTDEFHVYRLAIIKDNLEVYVDGENVAFVFLNNQVSNKVLTFGDGSNARGENIIAEVQYIAYSAKGAMTPWGEAVKTKSPPTAPIVAITPESPQKDSDLICEIITESTDPDGEAISYSYAWHKDGVLQPELTTNTVDSSNTDWDETWKCVVTPSDGLLDGPPSEDQVTIGIGIWTKFNWMQVSPDTEAVSPWQVAGVFETKFASGGILTIETRGTSTGLFTHPEDKFDNAVGSTVEIKMKLLEGPKTDHDASLFSLQDGTREGKISFFNDRIEIRDRNDLKATHDMDTTNGFHIYRLTLVKDKLEVYVDGEKVASVILNTHVTNKALFFGDGSIKEGENLGVQIDYIAYSVDGAIAPEETVIQP
ncbi:hypothetical protein ACFLU9_01140 [Chloroflexota bacterium]